MKLIKGLYGVVREELEELKVSSYFWLIAVAIFTLISSLTGSSDFVLYSQLILMIIGVICWLSESDNDLWFLGTYAFWVCAVLIILADLWLLVAKQVGRFNEYLDGEEQRIA